MARTNHSFRTQSQHGNDAEELRGGERLIALTAETCRIIDDWMDPPLWRNQPLRA